MFCNSAEKQEARSDDNEWVRRNSVHSLDSWYPNCFEFGKIDCSTNSNYCHWRRGSCHFSCNKIWNLPKCLYDKFGATKNCAAVHKKEGPCNKDHACKWDGTKCDFDCTNRFVYDYAGRDRKYCRAIAPCDTFGKEECIEFRDKNENHCRWYDPASKCMSFSELLALESETRKINNGFYDGQYHCDRTLEKYCERKACRWDGGKCKYHTCSVYNGDATECLFQSECTYNEENGACCKNGESNCDWPSSSPSISSSPSEQPTTSMQPSDAPSLQPSRKYECRTYDEIADNLCGVENGCYWDDTDGCVDDPCALKEAEECSCEDQCAWTVIFGGKDYEGKCRSLEHASCRPIEEERDSAYEIYDSSCCNIKSNCHFFEFDGGGRCFEVGNNSFCQ